MTNDEAIKRGAEAGMALRQALKEICGEKSEIAIRAAVIALTVTLTAPAKAHCYSVWKYPSPQHCGVVGSPRVRVAVARVAAWEETPIPAPRPVEPQPDIRLPDIDRPTPIEPTPDEKDQLLHALGIEMLKGQIGR